MISRTPQTIREFVDQSSERVAVQDRRVAVNRLRDFLEREPVLADLTLENLRAARDWLIGRGYRSNAVAVNMSRLRSIWREAHSMGFVAIAPPASHTWLAAEEPRPIEPRRDRRGPFQPPDGPLPQISPDSPLFDIFVHLANREAQREYVADNFRHTIDRFGRLLGRAATLADLTMENLSKMHASSESLGHSARFVTKDICGLRRLWRFAYGEGFTSAVAPARGVLQGGHLDRKQRPKKVSAPFRLPDQPIPTLAADSPLMDVFWHFARRLEGKSSRGVAHYRSAINRFGSVLGIQATLADLTDAKIDLFVEKASAMGYSHYTVENTRWNLRALWNHAHLEGIRADLPGGPRVPVNVPPARLVEDITSAVAIHRASVELEQRKDAKQAETPRQVLSMVGGALKRLFTPPAPPTRPPVVVAPPAPDREPESLTLSEVAAAWRTIAGKDLTTAEVVNMTCALRPMEVLYGHELASLFGAKKLKAVRDLMVGGYDSGGKHFRGLCRKQVNARMGRIKRVFKWAASEELVPVAVYQAIATLAALRPGRTTAPERLPVMPVDDAVFRSTLPFLSPVLAAMAELQYLGAMRPGEACVMRPCDLDRSGDVWEYRPHAHKGIWRSRERVVYIGPQAQKILEPFLDRDPEQYCFVPREAMFWRREKRRRERKSAVQPSQIDRSNPGPTKRPGVRYTTSSYSKAIKYACRKHHLPHWHPNQLRHAMATRVRKEFGLESAQVVLGHSRADVTQVYGERNKTLALDAVRKIG